MLPPQPGSMKCSPFLCGCASCRRVGGSAARRRAIDSSIARSSSRTWYTDFVKRWRRGSERRVNELLAEKKAVKRAWYETGALP